MPEEVDAVKQMLKLVEEQRRSPDNPPVEIDPEALMGGSPFVPGDAPSCCLFILLRDGEEDTFNVLGGATAVTIPDKGNPTAKFLVTCRHVFVNGLADGDYWLGRFINGSMEAVPMSEGFSIRAFKNKVAEGDEMYIRLPHKAQSKLQIKCAATYHLKMRSVRIYGYLDGRIQYSHECWRTTPKSRIEPVIQVRPFLGFPGVAT
jgi:hypothetical protein